MLGITQHPPYQTAVIVRKPYDGGFENLRGKRFCHPGFKHAELVTKLVLEEFESKIINLDSNYCNTGDNSSTIVEKRLRTVANFFGPSCRPGVWTESDQFDAELSK
ncbi:hypothetical protein NQ314_008437 [Rhamnusium bicolor]|uniref:Uncharacterized protein n=1 Tax=Rhamnusium bicolor TaxID=1586634 RepID=A0AAV8YBL5_9CUCU|nr:hypothetical protein NQ314_008437 [Rhamnusium bicolor]